MPYHLAPYLRLLLLCLQLGLVWEAQAQPLQVDALPDRHSGLDTLVLQEAGEPLTLEQAITGFEQGLGQPGSHVVLNFGIGSPPTWLRLQLFNPTNTPINVQVVTGTSWIDSLQLSLVQSGQRLQQWQLGDTLPGANRLVPGIGFVVPVQIPSGNSELYLRAQSADPLLLPFTVVSEQKFVDRDRKFKFAYGLIYGFLLAVIIYNSMLFIGLRDRSYLYYSIYLSLFVMLNVAYTGHGFAWFWPNNTIMQSHAMLVGMLLFGSSGLLFASSFLALTTQASKALRLLKALAILSIVMLLISIALHNPVMESLTAFVFGLIFTVSMALLGLTVLKQSRVAGRYYVIATFCGMLGAVISTLSLWGILPVTPWSYRAVLIGIFLQAILLALALSLKVRHQQVEKLQAERLSECDPLTGLLNRRGFNQQSNPLWSTSLRNQRPLSLIMLDIDHFKAINDQYGHDFGDQALQSLARLLENTCRAGDLTVRWGGEEFLLLLPETGLAEAHALAERLRLAVQTMPLRSGTHNIQLSCSFGVIARLQQTQLEQLIHAADQRLYEAKQSGRNRVCADEPLLPTIAN